MTKIKSMSTLARAAVAVATSILTGAGAGAALGRRPLVDADDRRLRSSASAPA